MTMNDTLSAALSKINNAEKIGKKECVITPVSKVVKRVLEILNMHAYVGLSEEMMERRGVSLKLNLLGNVNACGTIKPRFSTQLQDLEKWEKRYLPAKGFGIIIVSTPKGIMTHEEARKMNTGGTLLAYCY